MTNAISDHQRKVSIVGVINRADRDALFPLLVPINRLAPRPAVDASAKRRSDKTL